MTNYMRTLSGTAILVLAATVPSGAQHPAMPRGMTHEEHLAQLQRDSETKRRGAAAMGFDQDATSHHFLLRTDGGSIEVGVRGGGDAALREAVRSHLREVTQAFSEGNFDKPFATHGEVPSGVADMIRLQPSISYAFEEMANGGRVRIRTSSAAARDAVHAFLKYQIREHATGDPLFVKPKARGPNPKSISGEFRWQAARR
jgi:hypothetical protein